MAVLDSQKKCEDTYMKGRSGAFSCPPPEIVHAVPSDTGIWALMSYPIAQSGSFPLVIGVLYGSVAWRADTEAVGCHLLTSVAV